MTATSHKQNIHFISGKSFTYGAVSSLSLGKQSYTLVLGSLAQYPYCYFHQCMYNK